MIEYENLDYNLIMDNLSDPDSVIENQNQPMLIQLPGKALVTDNSANVERSPREMVVF